MPDSNLLVHEGCELSAWVAFYMAAVPHVLCFCWKWSMLHTRENCWASWNQYRWSVAMSASVYRDYSPSSLWTSLQFSAAASVALQFYSAFSHFLLCSTCWLLGRCACSRNMRNNSLTDLFDFSWKVFSSCITTVVKIRRKQQRWFYLFIFLSVYWCALVWIVLWTSSSFSCFYLSYTQQQQYSKTFSSYINISVIVFWIIH